MLACRRLFLNRSQRIAFSCVGLNSSVLIVRRHYCQESDQPPLSDQERAEFTRLKVKLADAQNRLNKMTTKKTETQKWRRKLSYKLFVLFFIASLAFLPLVIIVETRKKRPAPVPPALAGTWLRTDEVGNKETITFSRTGECKILSHTTGEETEAHVSKFVTTDKTMGTLVVEKKLAEFTFADFQAMEEGWKATVNGAEVWIKENPAGDAV